MKEIPIAILESWSNKLNISQEDLKKKFEKYEHKLEQYDEKFDDIYSYLHEKVLIEDFGINDKLEIDFLSKENRKLILSVIASISTEFYGENTSSYQKKYFFQLIKSFKVGDFSNEYNFKLLLNLDSKDINTYLYKVILEYIALSNIDKFELVNKNVLSNISLSSNIKDSIGLNIEKMINIFGEEILIYKYGTSYIDEVTINKIPIKYSLEIFEKLENDISIFSNVKIINRNLKESEILDTIIEYQLDIDVDNVLAIASNNQNDELFNGIIFMDDSFLILERGNRKDGNVQGQLDNLQDNLVNIKVQNEITKEVLVELYQNEKLYNILIEEQRKVDEVKEKINDILNNLRSVLNKIDTNINGIRVYYKDIEVFDLEDLENNGIEKILYKKSGRLYGLSSTFLTTEIKDIIIYFSKINGNHSLKDRSILHQEERRNSYIKAYDYKVFGKEVARFEREVHKLYENKLKNKSEWFDRFSIKTKQVENIKNLIDSSLEKDEIILFCDLAPFKKDGKEGIVITKDYISIRNYIGGKKSKFYFKSIKKFSLNKKKVDVELENSNLLGILEGIDVKEHYKILDDIHKLWKENKED